MQEELELIFPTEEYKEEIIDFKEEFKKNNETIIHGGAGLEKDISFEEWLKNVREDLEEETSRKRNRVPSAVYLAFRKSDRRLIGIVQIRYKLNEHLFNYTGHIGDSIRPSERNKGYSTTMIGLALEKAKEQGIGNVLMTCKNYNVASARTIIKNGGVMENEVENDGIIYQRYWITLKKSYADGRNKSNDILESTFKNLRIDNNEFKGNISLLKINKVRKEWKVDVESRCVLAKDYMWLRIYPDGENYCITAIFDDKDNIIEWYFDISRSLGIEDGVPYQDDLYLDVVVVPDGRIHILDEDELEEAYNKREISQDEYDMAFSVANMIINGLESREDIERLIKFSENYLTILKNS